MNIKRAFGTATRGTSGLGPSGLGPPALGPSSVPAGYPFRRAYRNSRERIVAGVAAGLADHLRVPVVAVRVAFVALLAANGLGALLYVAFWAVLRNGPEPDETAGSGAARPGTWPPGTVPGAEPIGTATIPRANATSTSTAGTTHSGAAPAGTVAAATVAAATVGVATVPAGTVPAGTVPWEAAPSATAQAGAMGGAMGLASPATVPADGEPARSGRRDRPADRGGRLRLQTVAFCALGIGILLLEIQFGWFGLDATLVALVALVAFGAGIIWHQAEPERRRRGRAENTWLRRPQGLWLRRADGETEPERRWFLLRVIGGGALVVIGIIGILGFVSPFGEGSFATTAMGLIFALLALAGVVLTLAPLLWRVFGQLRDERVARIREQERAEVAAVVHDQVLHTLALIQRNAGDSTSVLRLARGQERSLRGWLYKPTGSPAERFGAAIEEVAAEVEDTYAIQVEPVIVGDAPYDDGVAALVSAVREALVNAARHSKISTVSLYAEVEEEQIQVYVRDRGTGFDLSTVDDDRHGVRGSIIGRMRRHGGRAEIRTAPGEGTEVALAMPRPRVVKGAVP
jgi:signal transduction histidine kinase/phage shock protein PspC (stress-responsive transcriptional regulator)